MDASCYDMTERFWASISSPFVWLTSFTDGGEKTTKYPLRKRALSTLLSSECDDQIASIEMNSSQKMISSTCSDNDSGYVAQNHVPVVRAKNTQKLSLTSCVEIQIASTDCNECNAIICSADILKMKSGYFQKLLSAHDGASPLNTHPNTIWRSSIKIFDKTPTEAVSFVSSHH